MTNATSADVTPCFQLKSANASLTALELYFFDSDSFEATLRDKISQAPGFFRDIPLIVSLEKYEGAASELDFFKLIGSCRRHNIHVIGVRGGNEDLRRLARNAALALLPAVSQRDNTPSEANAEPDATSQPSSPAPQAAESATPETRPAKIVSQTVRSGQQVYAPDGDLVILAPVQAGAEVLAAGNIHVYGPLRGRALAGIHGASGARIFCQSLEAELVSIAGQYKISEDLQESGWKTAVQIQLNNDVLVASPLAAG